MAEGKNSILVYRDWIDIFENLEDDEAGRLIKHFFRYINDLNPDAPDRLTLLLFKQIQNTLKRDLRKWEKTTEERSKAGILGNLKRYNVDLYNDVVSDNMSIEEAQEVANARKAKQEVAKLADSVSDSLSDSVSDSDSVNEIKINKDIYISEGHLSITWDDMNKLIDEFGTERAEEYVNKVLNYRKNSSYKSLYRTALNWLRKEFKNDNKESLPIFRCSAMGMIKDIQAVNEEEASKKFYNNHGANPNTIKQIQ